MHVQKVFMYYFLVSREAVPSILYIDSGNLHHKKELA